MINGITIIELLHKEIWQSIQLVVALLMHAEELACSTEKINFITDFSYWTVNIIKKYKNKHNKKSNKRNYTQKHKMDPIIWEGLI